MFRQITSVLYNSARKNVKSADDWLKIYIFIQIGTIYSKKIDKFYKIMENPLFLILWTVCIFRNDKNNGGLFSFRSSCPLISSCRVWLLLPYWIGSLPISGQLRQIDTMESQVLNFHFLKKKRGEGILDYF